ncbi:hypothetical protein [Streptomyces sp. JB150]|uniref:hypothetical protein n=1 Tax=Streptomyces sp. JB150 TaxID=2714844 RepID=UPI001F0D6E85|nr:hypothetical protein [Streptomyces sp. JB150]
MAESVSVARAGALRLGTPSAIAVVAGAFTATQLLLVPPAMGLGWDEIVYVSQVGDHAPAAFFSAPRARGVSVLVAPIASWSSSTPLLRVYLAVLSGLALYLALRTWRGLFPARVLAGGGALFATLWVTLFYGPSAMPNYWVAVGALTAVGCFLRARADDRDRAALWGLAASAALMALMRPTDAVYVTAPLLVLALARRRWRPFAVLVAGLAAGGAQWVVEAYSGHGGLAQRLADASRIQGGLGWHFAVDDQLRGLIGRTLCRPCTGPLPHPAVYLWWFALWALAAVAVAVAVRARRPLPTVLPLACAVTAAVPYLFLIGYAAPRFLLPAYALAAIPVADALWRLATTPRGGPRPVAAVVVALGLAGHLAVQWAILDRTVQRTVDDRRAWARTAGELHRLGVRPPCLLTGHTAIPLAYYTGCSSAATGGNNENITVPAILDATRRIPVAALGTSSGAPPSYARSWTPYRFDRLRLYLAPPPGENGRA